MTPDRTLSDIAGNLRTLAPGESAGEAALRDLAGKLDRHQYADLAGVNLAQAYAPDVMLAEGAGSVRWLLHVLEITRDVLIFGPVIYTWWQLSIALRAYDHYTGKAPFLLAWQQGFGGHAQRLSTSALVVAAVVLGIVVLTLLAHLVRTWYESRLRHRQRWLAVLLAEAGMLVTRALGAGKADITKAELASMSNSIVTSAVSLRDALTKAGSDITEAVNTSPGSKLHDMFQKWTAAATELTALGTRLQGTQEMVSQLRTTQAELSGLSQQIGKETRQLITVMKNEREATLQAAHAHNKLAAGVGTSTERLGDSLKGLSERAEQFNEMVNRLAVMIETLQFGGNGSAGPAGGLS